MVDGLVTFIKEYQTLIAGILAVGAAVWATRPVRQQLNELKVQTAAARRDFIESVLTETANRRLVSIKSIRSVLQDPFSVSDDEENSIHPEWAFSQAGKIWDVLNKLQPRENDPQSIAVAISNTADAVRDLHDCLDAIHRPHSMHGDDDLTTAQYAELDAEANAMILQFSPRLKTAKEALKTLDKAFADQENAIRVKLSKVDSELLS